MFELPTTTWRIAGTVATLIAAILLVVGLARSFGGVDVYLQNVDGTGTRLSVPGQYLSSDAPERGGVVNYVGLTIQASDLGLDHDTDFDLFITLRAKSPLAAAEFSNAVRSQNFRGNSPIDGFELYRVSKGTGTDEFMRPKTQQGDRMTTTPFSTAAHMWPNSPGRSMIGAPASFRVMSASTCSTRCRAIT